MGQLLQLQARRNDLAIEALATKKQIAAVLAVSVRTIDNYVNEGMPFVPSKPDRQGRMQKRFVPSECMAWYRRR